MGKSAERRKEEINGLIYGLVQSGKTGVLTVTGAMGADEGYRTIIILTVRQRSAV